MPCHANHLPQQEPPLSCRLSAGGVPATLRVFGVGCWGCVVLRPSSAPMRREMLSTRRVTASSMFTFSLADVPYLRKASVHQMTMH